MMIRFTLFPAAIVLALSFSAQGATIFSENFNELTPQLAVTSVGAFSAIGGTNVDIVGPGLFGGLCAAPESGACVDLDGTFGLDQAVLQTKTPITLSPGVNYYLSFDLIGSQRGNEASTTVDFGPYSHTFDLASGDDTDGVVKNLLITVSSTTVTNLRFTSDTPGFQGDLLDNVLLTTGPSVATPEPSSVFLIVPAMLAAGLLARRFRMGTR